MPIEITLWMPATTFAEGDPCLLDLQIENLGAPRPADLYVLLDVFGAYWCYPSWQPLDAGIDYQTITVPGGSSTLTLIPDFTMPAVSSIGPLYFYAAMFEPGTLSLDTLVSNGAVWGFSLD